ncbi:helix-turn-helix domain-containing protein [Streptomyces sp. NPDC092296]|uniref:helix-turn-helix domain-containing protein n=1 Tax=Streptomyces sp. NPDC092296 TaxID=3366012 RepID=UPI0037FCDA63
MIAILDQPQFGWRLRALRLGRGLSQADLCGPQMSTSYLSRLESGTRPPTVKAVEYLAEKLDVTVAAFQEPAPGSLDEALARAVSAEDQAEAAGPLGAAGTDAASGSPLLRWSALWTLARISRELGRRAEEADALAGLAKLSADIGIPDLRVRTLTALSRCQRMSGEAASARTNASEAFALASEHKVPLGDRVRALLALVAAETEVGVLADARTHSDELEVLVEDIPGKLPVLALWTAATVRVRQGDHVAAQSLLERALDRLDSQQDVVLWMRLRLAAASLYLQMVPRRGEKAEGCLAEAEPALRLVGTSQQRQEFLLLKAQLALHQRDPAEAQSLYEQVDGARDELNFRDLVRLKVLDCQLRIHAGHRDPGVRDMEELAKQAQDSGNVDLAAEVWRCLAEALAR